MRKKAILFSTIAMGMAITFNPVTAEAGTVKNSGGVDIYYADSEEDAAVYLHEMFCTERKTEAWVNVPGRAKYDDLVKAIVKIDDQNNLYDGTAFLGQVAYSVCTYSSSQDRGTLGINIKKTYDIDKADAYGDSIVSLINEQAGKDATTEEKFYLALNYFGKNFVYDNERANNAEEANKKKTVCINDPFTDVLDQGGNQFICSDYANLFYIVGNKLGIDTIIVPGKDHLYNAVRFSPNSEYQSIDLTAQNAYSCRVTESGLLLNKELYEVQSTSAGKYTAASTDRELACTKFYELIPQWLYYTTHGIITSQKDYLLYAAFGLLILAIIIRVTSPFRHRR